jgi:hypothetical protein
VIRALTAAVLIGLAGGCSPVETAHETRPLRGAERELLAKLASLVRDGSVGGTASRLGGRLTAEEQATLRLLDQDLDRGRLGAPWPRVEWDGLVTVFGFGARVSGALHASSAARELPLARRRTDEEEARAARGGAFVEKFARRLEVGDLDGALRAYEEYGERYPPLQRRDRETIAQEATTRLLVVGRDPSEAHHRVLKTVARAIREARPEIGDLSDALTPQERRLFREVSQALDDGTWGFQWPRAAWGDGWQVLGFPIAVGSALAARHVAVLEPQPIRGEETARLDAWKTVTAGLADALEAGDWRAAERAHRSLEIDYPPWPHR